MSTYLVHYATARQIASRDSWNDERGTAHTGNRRVRKLTARMTRRTPER